MSEIKTCEQYIVTRLLDLEAENECQQDFIRQQEEIIRELESDLEFVSQFMTIRNSSGNSPYIDFDNVWKDYNADNFKRLCEIIGLTASTEEQ